jgi:mannose-6-phosphate isomerase-like protein (cupin superfamily)
MSKPAARANRDTTVVKIDSARSPRGSEGEKYLASGVRVSMRLWEDEPVGETRSSERDYETVGYVISGCAELHVEGQIVRLERGDSYTVPRGARHHYRILEPFTAVEATAPPAQVHGRDERGEPAGQVDRRARERFVHSVEAHASLPRHIPAGEAISWKRTRRYRATSRRARRFRP